MTLAALFYATKHPQKAEVRRPMIAGLAEKDCEAAERYAVP
jgi:hypothetical protein